MNKNPPITHFDVIPPVCPLSASQLGVYLECEADPSSVVYNNAVQYTLPDDIDPARFIEAAKTVAVHHPALFATIGTPGGVPSMLYRPSDVTVREVRADSVEAAISDFIRPFDLENGPLFRFEFVSTPEGKFFLSDVHHLLLDGRSIQIIFHQIADVYNGLPCPDETLTMFDAAMAEKTEPDPERMRFYEEYFDRKLGDIDCDSKPVSDVIMAGQPAGWDSFTIFFGTKETQDEFQHFACENGLSENALILGAFGYTLAKWNGASESVFVTGSHGRFDPRLSDTVGMFVRTLPLACRFDESASPAAYLRDVYNDFYLLKQNDCLSFSELSSRYGVRTDVSLVFHPDLFSDAFFEGKPASCRICNDYTSVASIEVMVIKKGDCYEIRCFYKRSDYTESFVRGLVDSYTTVLANMPKAALLGEVPLTSDGARAMLDRFNQTDVPYESEKTVVELFREQAAAHPDVPCLVFEDKRRSYREVDDLTDRLAAHLRSLGVGRGSVVGVLIPRCEIMLIGSLGVLKAGGAYLPLDPGYPAERLNLMMADSGASLLLTTPELSGIIDETFTGQRMMTDEIGALPPCDTPLPLPHKDDLFILLYTSGSTGTPKGVMFAHSNTMVTAAWERRFYELGVGCQVTAYASYGFDANVFDTYAAITSGATLHIISDEIRLDLAALKAYFEENGITHATMTTQVGRQFAAMGGASSLHCLNVAGEKLTPLTPPDGFRLYNLYGPTEGSILVSGFHVDRFYRDIPIGRAIDNVRFYVTDPCGRLLPAGAVGELWIAGAHVTAGYLNRPEKTAEAYGVNPFDHTPGYERIYRTGDIVRLMIDGNLQFIGRKDGQVKIRGFRVELTEVEEIIRRFDGIRDATVAAFDEPSGGKYLAAYIVADQMVDITAMNDFIRGEKPPYMVPAVTMQIDRIPLTQNQKVNKKALPRPEKKAENVRGPENEWQKKLYDLTAEAIGHRAFGIDTDLFDAGLSSIGALRLNVMLADTFDVPVRLDDIRRCPTVLLLEEMLKERTSAGAHEKQADYPLSRTQMGIYVECSAAPGGVLYNMPLLLKLGSGVDPARLKAAIRAAFDAHPYLKAVLFADDEGNIRARRRDDADVVIEDRASDGLPAPEELVRPFSLLESPLYRVSILRTPDGLYLFMDFHHIISDGTSEAVLTADIDRAYAGETLTAETYTGFEAALDEEAARASDRFSEAQSYFDGIFTGCDGSCLPPKAPEIGKSGAATVTVTLDGADRVAAYCDAHSFTHNAFFNAAFGYTLSRFGQFDDVVFTTVYHGRNDSRLASAVTMLVKTLPVLLHTDAIRGVADLIGDVQKQLMNSMANDLYSFAEIAAAYGIRSDVLFVYQGDSFAFDRLCGEAARAIDVLPSVAKAPLTVSVYLKNGRLEITVDYRQEIFGEAFIRSFLSVFEAVIRGFTVCDQTDAVPLLSDEADRQLAAFNDTARPYESLPVHRFFERHAAAHPDTVAVSDCERSLTYGELNAMANRIAHTLIKAGVKQDDVVGMMLDRTVMLSVTELGILKAGGAFLGLLPDYPDDRISFCLTDADSPCIITTAAYQAARPALFDAAKPYRTLTLEELLENDATGDPTLAVDPESLAYCIYTSGSTGTPKGVMIRHRNLACCAQPFDFPYAIYHGKDGGSVSLALSSVSFDLSVFDNLLMLMNGKTVCIASDREIHNPAALADLMQRRSVDMIAATPSFLTNALSIPEFHPALTRLKTLMSGAEAFPASLYDELKKIAPDLRILNGYGPSECTITCCAKRLSGVGPITIGGPTANTAFYVQDRHGRILPPYACGELIICGDLVGRGYVKLPEKTAAAFFTLRGMPAYHSGDVVRINADGEVEFFGRRDNQVKLRGFRVELDEIESCLCSFEGVMQSKVIVRNNGSEDYLAAFFTANRTVDLDELTTHLKARLTYYMVPDAILQLSAMPLTPNGKIDRKALPEIKRERKKGGRRAPKKSLEEELCELFRSVLSLDEFYADDNFFEMGGTSLSASKITMQLMSRGIKVEYQDVFSHPTPEQLADYIGSLTKPASADKPDEKAENVLSSPYDDLLCHNTPAHAADVKREPIGDVLLTGAVGFLGIHVLHELIERKEGKILCLVRKGRYSSPEARLKTLLMYYFDQPFLSEFGSRITVLDTDITDDRLAEQLAPYRFDTLINCAACVKHYAADDSIERINVRGVENLIAITRAKNARMIQISTTSVPGVHTDESWKRQVTLHENELFVLDDMDNKYAISKYRAELKMLDAIRGGMRGKIIRVGNLMGRHSDGEFQINFNTNAFLNALRGFAAIGKCPISHATDPMRFSPIDMTAKAVVLLAGTNDCFTAFHAENRFGFDEWQLLEAANHCGVTIVPVPDEEYYADYYRMLGDERVNARLQGLVTNDRPDLHAVQADTLFTANILYRLGFSWPLPDSAYLERAINSLLTLDYFEPSAE